jgi:hypothetical protein
MSTKQKKTDYDPGGWIAVPVDLMESEVWVSMNLKARHFLDDLMIRRGRGRSKDDPYVVTFADVEWARSKAGQSDRRTKAHSLHAGGWA